MSNEKVNRSKKPLKKRSGSRGRYLSVIMILSIFLSQPVQAHRNGKDCFYIPEYSSTIVITQQYGGDRWKNANWFTFGTEGSQEVEVYGKYKIDGAAKIDSLLLAFRIKHDFIPHRFDMLSICFDPKNHGAPSASNVLIRYDVFPTPGLVTCYSVCNSTDMSGNYIWKSPGSPLYFINTSTDWDTLANLWEAELAIDCQEPLLTGVASDSFGIYFQVLDFINDTLFMRYYWPTSASANVKGSAEYVPPANQWANGLFVNSTSNTQPDFFLGYWDLKINNSNTEFKIWLEEENKFSTIIQHTFFGGDLSGTGDSGILKFNLAEYGVSCYSESLQTTVKVKPISENAVEAAVHRPFSKGDSLTITLKSDFSYNGDAITSNNITVLNMKYNPAIPGKTISTPVTISNCSATKEIAIAYSFVSNAASLAARAASPLISPPNEPEIFYIFLDRSLLDTRKSQGEWTISFTPDDKEGLFPSPDSSLRDLYYIPIAPDSSVTFQIKITTPYYKFRWDKLLPFKLLKPSKPVSPVKPGLNLSSKAIPKVKRSQIVLPLDDLPLKKHPLGYTSGVKLKVYKEKQAFVKNETTYHLMKTVGYFGSFIDVIPAVSIVWKIFLPLLIIALIVCIYFLARRWKKREWDTLKFANGILILFLVLLVLCLIRINLLIV